MTTKDHVLRLLKHADGALSGEAIGETLGISRAAVNGAIRLLRGEGYEIASATRRGYLLKHAPDLLSAGELLSYLGEERMARVRVLDETGSTNRDLAQMALDGAPDGQVVIANRQTAGRGRLSRGFHSPAGLGVYFSYLIRPGTPWREGGEAYVKRDAAQAELSPAAWTKVTSMTAVAVSDAVEAVCGVRPGIKWVNDLYLGEAAKSGNQETRGKAKGTGAGNTFGKKICGILTQLDMEPDTGHVRSLVIGIGVNVHHKKQDFPEELRDIAGSIRSETGQSVSRAMLAAHMTRAMDRMRASLPDETGEYLRRYREASILPGTGITVISGETKRRARALFVADDYALRVRYEDGTEEALRGGEVSIRR